MPTEKSGDKHRGGLLGRARRALSGRQRQLDKEIKKGSGKSKDKKNNGRKRR